MCAQHRGPAGCLRRVGQPSREELWLGVGTLGTCLGSLWGWTRLSLLSLWDPLGPAWEGKQPFRPGLCWTWPCTFTLASLQCILQPTVASGRSAPFVLLKPGAVTQGGEEALHSSHRLCGSEESSTQESHGALAPKPQAAKGPSRLGKEQHLHTSTGGGEHLEEVLLRGSFKSMVGTVGRFHRTEGPIALGCTDSWFCTELCYVTFFCLLPSLSTSSHVRGWLFKEPHGHDTANSLLSPRQVDRKYLSCGQMRGTVGLVLL